MEGIGGVVKKFEMLVTQEVDGISSNVTSWF